MCRMNSVYNTFNNFSTSFKSVNLNVKCNDCNIEKRHMKAL